MMDRFGIVSTIALSYTVSISEKIFKGTRTASPTEDHAFPHNLGYALSALSYPSFHWDSFGSELHSSLYVEGACYSKGSRVCIALTSLRRSPTLRFRGPSVFPSLEMLSSL